MRSWSFGFREKYPAQSLALLEDQDEDSKVLFHSHSGESLDYSSISESQKQDQKPLF